jgi:predicted amidohydrolase
VLPLSDKTDIVILPEMFNTGFSMNPGLLSEEFDGETFQWMRSLAKKGNFGLCGSYIVKDSGKFFNRFVFVSPEGQSWNYNKRHLFSMGNEDKLFTPGTLKLTFTFRGFRISPYICYDLRFPVWSRNIELCDLIIYVSNWPESRKNIWDILLKARAIENQCYVAGSNRTGIDGEGIIYVGESIIAGPRGEIIASARQASNCSITAEISLKSLSEFRKKFLVLGDADDFTLNV